MGGPGCKKSARAIYITKYILLNKLSNYGSRGMAYTLIQSYLRNRKQFVSINQIRSHLRGITYEVPQGSSFGLLFFLLYINDLANAVESTPRFFVDDTCLLISAPDPLILQNKTTQDHSRPIKPLKTLLRTLLPTTVLMRLIWKSTRPGTKPFADRNRAAARCLPNTALESINQSIFWTRLSLGGRGGSSSSWSLQASRPSATKDRCSAGMPRRDQLRSST